MTFWQYLRQQRKRDDPVGDLARDACADRNFPRGSPTRERVRLYLMLHGACHEAQLALNQAYKNWQRGNALAPGTSESVSANQPSRVPTDRAVGTVSACQEIAKSGTIRHLPNSRAIQPRRVTKS